MLCVFDSFHISFQVYHGSNVCVLVLFCLICCLIIFSLLVCFNGKLVSGPNEKVVKAAIEVCSLAL